MLKEFTVISLGAGVQSTTLLLMAMHGEFDKTPDCAIFADTGAEPRAVYTHLEWLKSVSTIPIHVVNRGNLREDIEAALRGEVSRISNPPFFVKGGKDGKGRDHRGILRRKCTRDYKIDAIRRVGIREILLGLKPRQRVPKDVHIEQWIGISTDEIVRIKPAEHSYITHRWPLIEKEMSRSDCLRWLKAHGYPQAPKSSCTFCPYHSNAMWADIKENSPKEWADIVDLDRRIRTGLPGVKGEAYMHRSRQPIDQIDFTTEISEDDLAYFENECEGMCGV